ncbi:MAG: hypothetical protein WCO93_01125 [bacterium]
MTPRMMIAAVIFILLSAGCRQVVKMRYGVREPREETPASIIGFLKRMDQSAGSCFIFRDSASFCGYIKNPVFRENLLGSFFFNSRGLIIHYKDTNKCRWSATTFIKNLRNDTLYQVDTTFRFNELLSHLSPLITGDTMNIKETDYDFVIVITWAMFAGKLNERLFHADEALAENPRIRAGVLFLNMDMQKDWKLQQGQKLVVR